MGTPSQEIDFVFDKLLNISGSEGASLFSSEGHKVVFKQKTESGPAHLPESFSDIITTAIDTLSKANFGDLQKIIILENERKILIHKLQEKGYYSILVGTSEMNTGLACLKSKEMIPIFEKLIETK